MKIIFIKIEKGSMESSPWGPKINIDCSREQLKRDMHSCDM